MVPLHRRMPAPDVGRQSPTIPPLKDKPCRLLPSDEGSPVSRSYVRSLLCRLCCIFRTLLLQAINAFIIVPAAFAISVATLFATAVCSVWLRISDVFETVLLTFVTATERVCCAELRLCTRLRSSWTKTCTDMIGAVKQQASFGACIYPWWMFDLSWTETLALRLAHVLETPLCAVRRLVCAT